MRVQQADAEEVHRESLWAMLPRRDRARALMVAGMNQHRAGEALASFSAEERSLIYGHLAAHISKMECLLRVLGMGPLLPVAIIPRDLH